ncbi:MAG: hypothetical protein DMD37_03150 [Gemmatimonadetes bacterium]|nr:MAG: hypothetical protein DMD74_08325 [Gemmatimonadota bacterium]PYP64262.1 MAG: hypothetical protein DMD37_03150 [Gemmatimonadota bacterium]
MFRRLIPALAALLATAPVATQNMSGYRYSLRMTSSDGEDVVGTVRLAGDRERIDFPPGSRHDDGYFLLLNGGHTVATVHTDRREYEMVDDTTFQRLIGAALDAMGNLVTLHLADVKIETQSLGAGDSIAGYATRRFRLLQEYSVSIGAMGFTAANQHHVVVTDFWVSPDLRLPPNPLLELLATVETALAQRNEDFVHRSAAARAALFSGTPLKMVITSRSFDVDRGDSGRVAAGEHAVRTFEVTRVERASFDTSLFRIPDGFTRKDNPLSFKLF